MIRLLRFNKLVNYNTVIRSLQLGERCLRMVILISVGGFRLLQSVSRPGFLTIKTKVGEVLYQTGTKRALGEGLLLVFLYKFG